MYKPGDKFIIEIGEDYIYSDFTKTEEQKKAPAHLYRIKGFNSLVFDENGLDRLDKYSEDKSYDKGLSDAWECAKQVCDLSFSDAKEIYGEENDTLLKVMQNFTPQEAIEKLKAWETFQKIKKQCEDCPAWDGYDCSRTQEEDCLKEIKVGDVVSYGTDGFILVVTKVYGDGKIFDGVRANGETYNYRELSDCRKTGKYFDLTEIFKELEGEDANSN